MELRVLPEGGLKVGSRRCKGCGPCRSFRGTGNWFLSCSLQCWAGDVTARRPWLTTSGGGIDVSYGNRGGFFHYFCSLSRVEVKSRVGGGSLPKYGPERRSVVTSKISGTDVCGQSPEQLRIGLKVQAPRVREEVSTMRTQKVVRFFGKDEPEV